MEGRKSFMDIGEIYFFTATINKWIPLLRDDEFKTIITSSFEFLSSKGLLDIFGFVIMPNHIHVIWRTNGLNGKETVQGSFLKFTSHEFKKLVNQKMPELLNEFAVIKRNKSYEFWQRDPVAIHLFTRKVAFQKLEYLHLNPMAKHWELVKDPSDYFYSSAAYYEKDISNFSFLKDIRGEF